MHPLVNIHYVKCYTHHDHNYYHDTQFSCLYNITFFFFTYETYNVVYFKLMIVRVATDSSFEFSESVSP
jgi:hypothetical protein